MSEINLKYCRRSLDISIPEMSKKTGISQSALEQFEETGKLSHLRGPQDYHNILTIIAQKRRSPIMPEEFHQLLKPATLMPQASDFRTPASVLGRWR